MEDANWHVKVHYTLFEFLSFFWIVIVYWILSLRNDLESNTWNSHPPSVLFKPEERGHEYRISSVVPFALLLLLGKPLPSNHCVQLVHPTIWHYCLYEGNTEHCKRTGNKRDKTLYVILLYTGFSENLHGSAFREMTRQLVPLKTALCIRGYTVFCSHIPIYKKHQFLSHTGDWRKEYNARLKQDRPWQISIPGHAGSVMEPCDLSERQCWLAKQISKLTYVGIQSVQLYKNRNPLVIGDQTEE